MKKSQELKYYRQDKETLEKIELSKENFYEDILDYCNESYCLVEEYHDYIDEYGSNDFYDYDDYKRWRYLNFCETLEEYGCIEIERYYYYIEEV